MDAGPAFSLPWPEMKDDFRKGTAGKLRVCSGKWPKYILFIFIYLKGLFPRVMLEYRRDLDGKC
jgi:hypothetical protein